MIIDWTTTKAAASSSEKLINISNYLEMKPMNLSKSYPGEWVERTTLLGDYYILLIHVKVVTHLRILLAELQGQSWPMDPFDREKNQLHRLEREGKLMGAYSFGQNRKDDGGDKTKDDYFPLYGPPEPPSLITP
jgi:hypothetical protein